jgi:hypothetical protein
MTRQRLSNKQLRVLYALFAEDQTAGYTDQHLAFLAQRRDSFLASLKK